MTCNPANIYLTFDESGLHSDGTEVIELGAACAFSP